ncbi:MAG: dihydrolipoamide acetyltransferase family protein [Chloroflexi bacterium]|nr:dihydrolipoamide acetyltransferase family protein [Chloroflexota bacterium]
MAKEVFIPQLGQTVVEVTLLEWSAADGAQVQEGQQLLLVQTDKTDFPIDATADGTLHRGPFSAGQVVPVLTVVAVIGKQEEAFDKVTGGQGDTVTSERAISAAPLEPTMGASDHLVTLSPSHRVMVSPRARKLAEERGVDLAKAAISPTGGAGVRVAERDVLAYLVSAPKATPLAERLAAEAGIPLRDIAATGPGGRITKEDVEHAVQLRTLPATEASLPQPAAPVPAVPSIPAVPAAPSSFQPPASSHQLPPSEVTDRIPLKGVRAIIADRMGTSVHTTARVTLMMEVDATEFVAMRERLKARVEKEWGFAPGYNDLLAKIVAAALRKFPFVNARLAPDAIELLAHVNLGMAVDTERGLLVPVIRDADKKSLRQFGAEFREMVDRARKGRSLPDDLSGGSFTITNLGMYDVDAFTPVINLPEAAILGLGRIAPKWVYRAESPAAPVLRQMWTLSLVFDHRLVDGAPAARFLQFIKGLIEEPYLLLAE